MANTTTRVPRYPDLLKPVCAALKARGGTARNEEILSQIITDMKISGDVAKKMHGKTNQTELDYQTAWARTYLSNAGVITRSGRGVWSIKSDVDVEKLNCRDILRQTSSKKRGKKGPKYPSPEEAAPWREQLGHIICNMDPWAFERLCQYVLRESGFTNVQVTPRTRDGGIDGTGELKINGIFTAKVAFQCKRYTKPVSSPMIQSFRGSLGGDCDYGVLITSSAFTEDARREALCSGNRRIDLMDGNDLIDKLIEFGIGIRPITVYEVDEKFFSTI